MLDVFICDSDRNTIECAKAYFDSCYRGKARVSVFFGRMDLIGAIQLEDRVPDILITETVFRDGNGIDTVAEIQTEHPEVKVIYVSEDVYQSTEIFRTTPSFFLTKPIDEVKFDKAVAKAAAEIAADRACALLLKGAGSERVVLARNITYIENRARKLTIHFDGMNDISVYEKMDDIQRKLGRTFVRCHKSFLVNLLFIESRENAEFVLVNGKRIPISSRRSKEAKAKFTQFYEHLSGMQEAGSR